MSKVRREKAPKEGFNYLRFLENFSLKEIERYTLRQLYAPEERTDIARRQMTP